MTLVDFVRLLLRHARLLLLATVAVSALVLGVLSTRSAEYESSTIVYTGIVSGYSPDAPGDPRADMQGAVNAFDNLIALVQSQETARQVSVRLLADALANPVTRRTSTGAWRDLVREVKPTRGDTAATRTRVEVVAAVETSVAALLLDSDTSPFGARWIQANLKVKRIGTSDLLELRLRGPDATLTARTLELVLANVMHEQRNLRSQSTGAVIAVFEAQVTDALQRMQSATERLKRFGVDHRVINYYEQTKAIAGQQGALDEALRTQNARVAAARAGATQLAQSLVVRRELTERSDAVATARRALGLASARLAVAQAEGRSTTADEADLARQQQELQVAVERFDAIARSPEGMPRAELARAWSERTLNATESAVTADSLRVARDSYGKIYDRFAPLGSGLQSLEREVGIAERAYLEALHSLNLARLRQQSVELAANMDVIDAPRVPRQPLPSQRLLLTVAAGLATALLLVFSFVAGETLDVTLRSPERAEARTGLTVAGAVLATSADRPATGDRLARQLVRSVRLRLHEQAGDRQARVIIAPLRLQDGDDRIAALLAPVMHAKVEVTGALHDDAALGDTLAGAQLVLLVARASRRWDPSDERLLDDVRRATGVEPLLLLTDVNPARVDHLTGDDTPEARSPMRRSIARLARLEFAT